MAIYNREYNINKLALIGAILILIVDFIELLIIYQRYYDRLNEKDESLTY